MQVTADTLLSSILTPIVVFKGRFVMQFTLWGVFKVDECSALKIDSFMMSLCDEGNEEFEIVRDRKVDWIPSLIVRDRKMDWIPSFGCNVNR